MRRAQVSNLGLDQPPWSVPGPEEEETWAVRGDQRYILGWATGKTTVGRGDTAFRRKQSGI